MFQSYVLILTLVRQERYELESGAFSGAPGSAEYGLDPREKHQQTVQVPIVGESAIPAPLTLRKPALRAAIFWFCAYRVIFPVRDQSRRL